MTTVLHPLVHIDILEAMHFYEREGGGELAADFFYEYERTLQRILERPLSFPNSDEVLRRDVRPVPVPYPFQHRNNPYFCPRRQARAAGSGLWSRSVTPP